MISLTKITHDSPGLGTYTNTKTNALGQVSLKQKAGESPKVRYKTISTAHRDAGQRQTHVGNPGSLPRRSGGLPQACASTPELIKLLHSQVKG